LSKLYGTFRTNKSNLVKTESRSRKQKIMCVKMQCSKDQYKLNDHTFVGM